MSAASHSAPQRWHTVRWVLAGAALGLVLAAVTLSLPPVQAWLLRRALASQPGTAFDFTRIALGPRGAEATDVKLRLPNLTLEARALRIAISPWQLLSRRRLAIADLQARQIAVEATTGDTAAANSPPFAGMLDSFQAPLAWACEKAEADGVLTVLQPGSPAVAVTLKLTGANLDIAKPGRLHFEFSTPGEFVAGFKGSWKFKGSLDFVPGAAERIDSLTINGQLTPALSESLRLPSVTVRLSAMRTPDGERYEIALSPEGDHAASFAFESSADFKKASAMLAGNWKTRGVSGLVAHILQRTDLPLITADNTGEFSVNTLTGEADATVNGSFTGSEWQRFDATLAAIDQLTGRHAATLQRRNGAWTLTALTADAKSAGSDAALQLTLDRPVKLPPGGDGDVSPWGKLRVEKIPLGWAAPILEVERITGGEFAGSWSVASPDAATLRFEPLETLAASHARFVHAALSEKKNPALSFAITSRLTLTAEEAHVEIPELLITSEQADQARATVEARVSLDTLEGTMTASWRSQLPTWLGGAQAPAINGSLTATGGTERATITALHLAAVHADSRDEAFSLDLLAPLKIDFDNLSAVEASEGDVLKFTARTLQLDWAASLLPGFTFSGVVTEGASTLRREGREFVFSTSTPWKLRELHVGQGGLALLRASEFSAAPEGRVQLNADWSPGDFLGQIQLEGKIAEVFGLRDPAGDFRATGHASGSRRGKLVELRAFNLAVQKHDGSALLDVETLQPAVLGATAKNNDIDQAPDWLRVRTTAIPLAWLQPFLPAGLKARGTLEPTEFSLKMELPNAFLQASRPLAVALDELHEGEKLLLRDIRIELKPAVIVMGMFSSLALENVSVVMNGQPSGSGGLSLLYLTSNLKIPGSISVDFTHEIAPLRAQPVGAELPLPVAGTARVIYQHDVFGKKRPVGTFLLNKVPGRDGQDLLPPLGIRLTQLEKTPDGLDRMKLEFQYQTAPVWSQINAEFSYAAHEKIAEINTTLRGDFFDLGSFERLVDAFAPAVPATEKITDPSTTAPQATAAEINAELGGAFWQALHGRFELEFGQLAYDAYRIDGVTGELTLDASAVHLRNLSGRMFDGEWRGNFLVDYDAQQPAAPYALSGGFEIKNFSASEIVRTAYPTELGSFDGRLNFSSRITSRTESPLDLIDRSTANFEFSSQNGRLKLDVPYADVASAGLIVGGAITFSPELRALGRLIKQFSDLPVDTLAARGERRADGTVTLQEFKLGTPQLRLSAQGTVPFVKGVDLAARPFALPVTLEAKDEIAVILRGMKLLEKKPAGDGFFALTKQPALRGTLGQPDTTELYDVFAKAVDSSSGTFGLLMKKVRKEVEKAQAASAKK